MKSVIQYDTSNELECLSAASILFGEAVTAITYAFKALFEEYRLHSLVHFCQTGKFLDEI